jgi:hypothetical protein
MPAESAGLVGQGFFFTARFGGFLFGNAFDGDLEGMRLGRMWRAL